MALIDKVKTSLRVSGSAFDEEIADLILACKKDLEISGIDATKIIDTDTLIVRAVTTYCKSHFGMANPDSEKYQESYTLLKTHLSLSGDYRVLES